MSKLVVLVILAIAETSLQKDGQIVKQAEGEPSLATLQTQIDEMGAILDNQTKSIESMNNNLQAMMRDIAMELAAFRKEVNHEIKSIAEKKSFCSEWKSKVGGLPLNQISTGVYFYGIDIEKSHSVAKRFCNQRGMRLAVFESKAEMIAVAENAPIQRGWYWVGAAYQRNTSDFRWSSGAKVASDFWQSGEPDISSHKACVFLRVGSEYRNLYDYNCEENDKFVCEVDPQYVDCV